MKYAIQILALTFVLFQSALAQSSQVPSWLRAHMDYMTQGSGVWVTSNDKFKSDAEPFDQYVTEWKYSVGKMGMNGRLYGIRDGKPTGDFWEYHVYWHPKDRVAYIVQLGAGGAFGIGEVKDSGLNDPPQRFFEMEMVMPDGSDVMDLHRIHESGKGEHKTVSFDFREGEWIERRTYVWKLK